MRAWMTLVALGVGDRPNYTWVGTFAAILLPAALMGAILGAASYAAGRSTSNRWRWSLISPLLLALTPAVITPGFITTLVTTGLGGGAIGVAFVGVLGGYAFSGFGPRWTRWISFIVLSLLAIATVLPFYLLYNGASATPWASDVFSLLLFFLLMALLIAGVSAPARYRSRRNVSIDYAKYRGQFFTDPTPKQRFGFAGLHGITLYFTDYTGAMAYYQAVFGPPAYVEGEFTHGWQIGDTWLTLLKGESGSPANVEMMLVMKTPLEVDRLAQVLVKAGGVSEGPTDQIMYEPVRYASVRDSFGTQIIITSPLQKGTV